MEPAEARRDVSRGSGGSLEEVRDEAAAVVAHVQGEACADLLQVVRAADGLCLQTRLGERGEQHGGQNRDDGDDDQQLNQCKPFLLFHFDLVLGGIIL